MGVKAQGFFCKVNVEQKIFPGFNHEYFGMVSLGHCYKLYSSVCHGTPSTKGYGNLAPVPARGQCEAEQDFGPSDPKWLGIPILPEGDRFALSS